MILKIFIYIFKVYILYFLKKKDVNMNNEKIINHESSKDNRPIIFFNNNENPINEKNKDNNVKDLKNKSEHTNILYYITTCIISVLIYSFCAWGSNIAFTEIIDLELPLVILFTIILTSAIIQGYSKISYASYIILSCIFYFISPSYTFFFTTAFTSNIIVNYIKHIYYNENDYGNKKTEISKNRIIKFLSRMKYYVILSLILFIIFLILGYVYAGIFQSIVLPSVQGLNDGVQQGTVKLETLSLFINNFSVALNIVFGGLYFSIMSLYLLIFNALVIGYVACTTDLVYFLSFTLPHGIIELFAIILAGATGFRVTHAIFVLINGIKINQENRNEIFVEHVEICCKMLSDVLIMIVIIALLLIIAAFIEANFTIPIGKGLYEMIYLPKPI